MTLPRPGSNQVTPRNVAESMVESLSRVVINVIRLNAPLSSTFRLDVLQAACMLCIKLFFQQLLRCNPVLIMPFCTALHVNNVTCKKN